MLLELPSEFKKPRDEDGGDEIELACDWIEASVLFSGETVDSPHVIDILQEKQHFSSQEKARIFVDEVWSRLKARKVECGNYGPFDFDYQQIILNINEWKKAPAFVFCVLLSYARHHRAWAKLYETLWNYNKQGEIFESLTYDALRILLPCWMVYKTGWSPSNPTQLSEVARTVAELMCGRISNLERWNSPNAKEQGLDILCVRQFHDKRGNFPAFIIQCASGHLFSNKFGTPSAELWNDLVEVLTPWLLQKGFVIPYALSKKYFEQCAILVRGLFFDRNRLLSVGSHDKDWLNTRNAKQINSWARPIVRKLPWIE